MVLQQVPVIDIAPFLKGDEQGKLSVVAEGRQACEDIGFFVMIGKKIA